jgi:DnaJ-class molecular chaperone
MSKPDYYVTLGLTKAATEDDIKKSYRKLASKFHPDKVAGEEGSSEKKKAEESFKEVKEAYETLSDSFKRSRYDLYGHEGAAQPSRSQSNAYGFNHTNSDDNFKDLFAEMFKSHPEFSEGVFGKQKPRTEIYTVTISLKDAYLGRTVNVLSNMAINIPRGVRSGTKLFVGGKMFRIDVMPDPKFKRSNDDLLLDVEISAIEAMLGVDAVFDHLDGKKLQFTIPAGIQAGQIVKLGKKGMRNPETDQYGDMLVRIFTTIPRTLTQEERIALKTIQHRESINL